MYVYVRVCTCMYVYSGKVNLDVSSMLAWVSALTHGGEVYTFKVSTTICIALLFMYQ